MVNQVIIEATDSTVFQGQITVAMIKKSLGGTFANVATELAKVNDDICIAIVEETHATGAGTRFYMKNKAGAWKYVAMT